MRSSPTFIRRFVRLLLCAAFGLAFVALPSCITRAPTPKAAAPVDSPTGVAAVEKSETATPTADAKATHSWPTFFGSPSRNPVNTVEKNIATEWSIEEGAQKNIKWVVTAGSRSYAGPVFADGRIFVGTNNQ